MAEERGAKAEGREPNLSLPKPLLTPRSSRRQTPPPKVCHTRPPGLADTVFIS